MLVTKGVTVAPSSMLPNPDRSSVTARSDVVLLTWTTVAASPEADTAAVLLVSSTPIRWSPGAMKCVKFCVVWYLVLV
ncbi:hypothetical protein D3C74_323820 [compost metagenome]